jgi:hypothetical protein
MPIRFSQLKLPLLVFLSAIVFVIGGIFFFGQTSQPPEGPTTQSTPSPSPVPTPQPAAMPEIPDNWQTYRNAEFGFEVKYPETFSYSEFKPNKRGEHYLILTTG